ncbi:S-layer homology domain-containing protein [Cytobacillus depressus]|uniref:S-layer homology domain-containing protein n=1 Tax=Cytobacillus depressus TaxID=1602942 RepID=A0A6L3VC13_9BACI|nr:S-layer homology domain-containing protein [Cytobacillus depressus]KAB2336743.1 S-layer homology domain-containing protein [Cytobacillus depressus]
MKKYPFSNKAMKAMLAASIALSPFAASAISAPVKVEASDLTDAETDLINELNAIYQKLKPEQKSALRTASQKLNDGSAINTDTWNKLADELSRSGKATGDERDLLVALAKLFADASLGGLGDFQTTLSNFKDAQRDNVATVFNQKITVNQLADFIVKVESDYIKRVKKLPSNATNEKYYDEFYNSLESEAIKSLDVAIALFKIINEDNAKSVVQQIVNAVDKDKTAREAFIAGIKEASKDSGTGGGGGGGAIVESPIELPPGSTTIENRGNDVVTQILADKVQAIVNLITATNNVIPVKLEKVSGDKKAVAEIPASLFTEAAKKNSKAVVSIETDAAVYKLPVSEINVSALAQKLGVAAGDVKIDISVNVVSADVKNKVSEVVEFQIFAVAGDKKEAITAFSTYVDRVIMGSKDFSKGNSVAVRINNDGSLTSIPTIFNGKNATVKSLTNSKYTVVENNISFKDVTDKSWAKGYIETLANKLIVKGKAADKYAPADHMTRAEFTVLLVRALGLPAEKYDGTFKDVKGTEWFNENGEIMAAVKHGIIKGVSSNQFAPQNKITRAEAAVMIERAMNLSFVNYDNSQLDSKKTVADFKDASKLQDWNKKAIEAVYQADIVSGRDTKEFDPKGYTQRDEMAKILANFLKSAKLMN